MKVVKAEIGTHEFYCLPDRDGAEYLMDCARRLRDRGEDSSTLRWEEIEMAEKDYYKLDAANPDFPGPGSEERIAKLRELPPVVRLSE